MDTFPHPTTSSSPTSTAVSEDSSRSQPPDSPRSSSSQDSSSSPGGQHPSSTETTVSDSERSTTGSRSQARRSARRTPSSTTDVLPWPQSPESSSRRSSPARTCTSRPHPDTGLHSVTDRDSSKLLCPCPPSRSISIFRILGHAKNMMGERTSSRIAMCYVPLYEYLPRTALLFPGRLGNFVRMQLTGRLALAVPMHRPPHHKTNHTRFPGIFA
mmetsp:Transcript_21346/g.59343  ORF Transcript_21346/g.59343 Transcript_21346/m.59343 type:complete len:214 (+) Transcript_21346:318-959(+)